MLHNGDQITIEKDPRHLTETDLEFVYQMACTSIRKRSVKLAKWFIDHVELELERRLIDSTMPTVAPVEVEFPRLTCSNWSNHELADALAAIQISCDVSQPKTATYQLCDAVRQVLAFWASHRLRR
jgi:hypothetical protein